MVNLAVRRGIPHLLSSILDKWSERVYHKSTPSVPAMQAADKHELLSLRGVAYYVHVQDMLDRQSHTPEGGGTQLRVDPKLNNGQVIGAVDVLERSCRMRPVPSVQHILYGQAPFPSLRGNHLT